MEAKRSKSGRLLDAIHCTEPVSGFTHEFYRYPARFSPLFAREVIASFTQPGDLVFDPFMGGGTTIVESRALARNAIGTDISSLSAFISQSKSTVLPDEDLSAVRVWAYGIVQRLNAHQEPVRATDWLAYQRNISSKSTWPIRKLIELALSEVQALATVEQQNFARCVLLRTGQWALDCRSKVPSASAFRQQFMVYLEQMIAGAQAFAFAVHSAEASERVQSQSVCLHRSAIGIESDDAMGKFGRAPKLILTSPPYPGVHVLYHRWQVLGRRETPAPFWIAGSLDGSGASFYNFGGRHQQDLTGYFDQAFAAFKSVANIADGETIVIQMVAFSDPSWQLPRYLEVLGDAGLKERKISGLANSEDGRVWRSVPNRKWYADQRGDTAGSKEVVLFHSKSRK